MVSALPLNLESRHGGSAMNQVYGIEYCSAANSIARKGRANMNKVYHDVDAGGVSR